MAAYAALHMTDPNYSLAIVVFMLQMCWMKLVCPLARRVG